MISTRFEAEDPAAYRDLISLVETQAVLALSSTGPLPEPGRGRVSRRVRSFPVTPRVTLNPDERAQRWLLSVSASDRSGLLYAIARVLARHHINLHLAKVSTLGERVEDTFLVDGAALQRARTQLQIETELLDAVRRRHGPRSADEPAQARRRQPRRHRRRSAASTRRSTCAPAAEFAEDHLPGAVNWPVLDDEQRRIVGTLYKQVSPLQARKVGAAMVARNIADHLERWVADQPREWQPLVYCWRGGQRSGTLAWFLSQIGFRTGQLQGGYKAFRARVRDELQTLPQRHRFQVLCGRTGSGKTRLLHALAEQGAQMLDLEGLAGHRGSVLGALPGRAQPSQKRFDTLCWQALRGFDATRPVFVEGESRKIGRCACPKR